MLISFDSPLEVDRPKDWETTGMQRPCVAAPLDRNIPHEFYTATAKVRSTVHYFLAIPITPLCRKCLAGTKHRPRKSRGRLHKLLFSLRESCFQVP